MTQMGIIYKPRGNGQYYDDICEWCEHRFTTVAFKRKIDPLEVRPRQYPCDYCLPKSVLTKIKELLRNRWYVFKGKAHARLAGKTSNSTEMLRDEDPRVTEKVLKEFNRLQKTPMVTLVWYHIWGDWRHDMERWCGLLRVGYECDLSVAREVARGVTIRQLVAHSWIRQQRARTWAWRLGFYGPIISSVVAVVLGSLVSPIAISVVVVSGLLMWLRVKERNEADRASLDQILARYELPRPPQR